MKTKLIIGMALALFLGGCTFTEGWKLGAQVKHSSGVGVSVDYEPELAGLRK